MPTGEAQKVVRKSFNLRRRRRRQCFTSLRVKTFSKTLNDIIPEQSFRVK